MQKRDTEMYLVDMRSLLCCIMNMAYHIHSKILHSDFCEEKIFIQVYSDPTKFADSMMSAICL